MRKNTIVILSDEHAPQLSGYAGHPLVKTPNLDRLAGQGTVFSSAYCTSPICVPSRAGIATGRYPHQHHYWDNAFPYDGRVPGWGHALIDAGIESVSIGKLHYRLETDSVGLSAQINPMHVIDGVGDLVGMIRDQRNVRVAARKYYENPGAGDSTYQRYDRQTAALARQWLTDYAEGRHAQTGFTLLVSFVCPHFPLVAPQEYIDLYPPANIELPTRIGSPENWHPGIRDYAHMMNFLPPFTPDQIRRALSAYYALITFLDAQVGEVLQAIDELGLGDETTVIYTSDHGDNAGRDGLFGKSTMYDDSVGVPLICRGAAFPPGTRHHGPVSHVDLYQTILENHGLTPGEPDLPGTALQRQIAGEARHWPVIAEYHATCSLGGITMLRQGRWKYIHYADYPPQLFDLESDPTETNDLGQDPAYLDICNEMQARLRQVMDIEGADRNAKRDQAERIVEHGGEDQILSAGTLGYTPAPGEAPDLG